MEIMFETKQAKLLMGRDNEDNGDCVRCYADFDNLGYIVISSKGLVHELGRTLEEDEAKMAYFIKELEVFGN